MSNEVKYVVQEVIRLYKLLPDDAKEEVQKQVGLYKAPEAPSQGFYKIMHKPTGLFSMPLRHGGSNVSKTGKTFEKIGFAKSSFNPEKSKSFRVVLSKRSPLIKIFEDLGHEVTQRSYSHLQVFVDTPASEWEIVQV